MSKSKISSIKHSFFDKSLKKKDNFSFKSDDFNLDQLQNEFTSLYQLFISKHLLFKNPELISYMYYLCNLMSNYYQCDYVHDEVQQLAEKRKIIEGFINEHFTDQEQVSIFEPCVSLDNFILDFTPSLISISKFRKYIGLLNTKRSYWGYSRALANHAIIYFQNNCISDPLCISAEVIDLLNQLREPLIVLGITLYFLRFLINFVIMLKHIIHAAMCKELSVTKVLKQELDKRGYTMASDLIWAIVNLLINYNNFFQISASVISPLITCILFFDFLLFLAQWSAEAVKYNKCLEELKEQQRNATVLEFKIIERQIDILNDEWEVRCDYFLINILAANLIFFSFGITLLCTGPLALAALAFFSSIGNALYNTTEEFIKYQQTTIALQRELSNGTILDDEYHQKLIIKLNNECTLSSSDFWNTLACTIGGTAFIITTAVLCWPAALCLTLSYIAYQLNDSYQKTLEKEDKKLKSPPNDIYRLIHLEDCSEETVLRLSC